MRLDGPIHGAGLAEKAVEAAADEGTRRHVLLVAVRRPRARGQRPGRDPDDVRGGTRGARRHVGAEGRLRDLRPVGDVAGRRPDGHVGGVAVAVAAVAAPDPQVADAEPVARGRAAVVVRRENDHHLAALRRRDERRLGRVQAHLAVRGRRRIDGRGAQGRVSVERPEHLGGGGPDHPDAFVPLERLGVALEHADSPAAGGGARLPEPGEQPALEDVRHTRDEVHRMHDARLVGPVEVDAEEERADALGPVVRRRPLGGDGGVGVGVDRTVVGHGHRARALVEGARGPEEHGWDVAAGLVGTSPAPEVQVRPALGAHDERDEALVDRPAREHRAHPGQGAPDARVPHEPERRAVHPDERPRRRHPPEHRARPVRRMERERPGALLAPRDLPGDPEDDVLPGDDRASRRGFGESGR